MERHGLDSRDDSDAIGGLRRCPHLGLLLVYVVLRSRGAIWPNSDEYTYAPLAEIWNGSTWAVQVAPAPPNPGPAAGSGFYSVSCTSPDTCTAVGYAPSENFSKPEVTLVETWNGSAWQEQAGPVRGGQLNGISCLSTSFCIAVGYARAEQWPLRLPHRALEWN